MTTKTASGVTPAKKSRVNRFDSPWLNRRFITGVLMIGFIVAMGLFGPLFWDIDKALVGSSPLNLPPMWIQAGEQSVVVNRSSGDAPAAATAEVTPTSNSGFGSSGLGGSGLTSLMSTQTAPANEAQATATDAGFGGSGLGGSGLSSLMSTQSAPPTATDAGFGGSGLGGSGLNSLMSTQSAPPTATDAGFGGSGLGGSGLNSLMTTQSAPETEATATPVDETAETTTTTTTTTTSRQGRNQLSGDPAHPLGTDNSGRDILAVLIYGAPASLRVGVIAASIGILLGIVLGFSSGFLGGWVDTIIRTAADVWLTIPSLAVLLVVSAYLKRVDLDTMAILLSLFSWPGPTRLIRAQVLTLRERGYIKMAQLSGQSTLSIMFREMLPNLLPYLAATFAGNVSGAILAASSLEALGLGPTRYPTLGTTIFNAIRATAIMRNMWWWWGFPVLTLMFIFTGLFQIAVGLDEIANPRLRGATQKS